MTQTALILGATGKIGRHFTAAFHAAGWQTRAYTRGTDMSAAAQGCAVIVNGQNPPNYHDWARILPQITEQVIAAAKASGATILFPGNVYVFGTQTGPWDESTPHRPNTRKGAIRSQIEARYRDSGVPMIVLRAGDFIDPDSDTSIMDIAYLRALAKGTITTMGNPDVQRAYAWLPDMARAGVALALKRAELPAYCEVPFPGHTISVRGVTQNLARITGRPLRITNFPWWAMRLASPFWELARELSEMRYLFDLPHSLSGTRLQTLLPDFQPTPLDTVLTAVLARRAKALG